MHRSGKLTGTFSFLLSLIIAVTYIVLPESSFSSRAAVLYNPNGTYLSEAFNIAGGNFYNQPRSQWISFLDSCSKSDYYLGTPYDDWLYSASPRGDKWQISEGCGDDIVQGGGSYELGGMNSTGFIWHIISRSLSEASGYSISVTGTCVPMLSGFNSMNFSRSCWSGGGNRWYDFIQQYNVKYYEFSTKSEMLSSGVLCKGDIIWCVDVAVGTLMNGLSIPADNHHVGIYMGSGSDDLWWQTGPTTADGDFSEQYNSINPIYGCAYSNTYIVLPWDGTSDSSDPPPVTGTDVPAVTTTAVSGYREYSTRTVTAGLCNPKGNYFSYGIKQSTNGTLTMSLSQWQSFIDEYSTNDYYIGTPYSTWLYAASPKGDLWQYREGGATNIISHGGSSTEGGLNCMAFVWHALAKGISLTNSCSIEYAGTSVPFTSAFNTMFTRKSWGTGNGWLGYISTYDLRYYEFSTKEEMLSSGALRKGDLIWCVDSSCGKGLNGLRQLSDDHHVGIYTGNGHTDQWWQSGPTLGDHNFKSQKNSVNPIYGCAVKSSYVVIPFADEIVRETLPAAITTTVTAPATAVTSVTTVTSAVTSQTAAAITSATTTVSCPVVLCEDADKLISGKDISPADIVISAAAEGKDIPPEMLSFGGGTPELIFEKSGNRFVCTLNIYLDEKLIAAPVLGSILKGDVNSDGFVNAADASSVLCCYAHHSVGDEWYFTTDGEAPDNLLRERLACLAADIDTESATMCSEADAFIDSTDASAILAYYARISVDQEAEWD